MKVYIVGYMGVGKTTLGKRLANALELPFSDLDTAIERASGSSIAAIFAGKGEAAFREMERQQLVAFAKSEQSGLLSTGGGAPMHHGNMDLMLRTGVVVWLQLSPKMIASRLLQSANGRPLLTGIDPANLPTHVENHLNERTPTYQRAHLTYDSGNIQAEHVSAIAHDIRQFLTPTSLQNTPDK